MHILDVSLFDSLHNLPVREALLRKTTERSQLSTVSPPDSIRQILPSIRHRQETLATPCKRTASMPISETRGMLTHIVRTQTEWPTGSTGTAKRHFEKMRVVRSDKDNALFLFLQNMTTPQFSDFSLAKQHSLLVMRTTKRNLTNSRLLIA